MKLLLYVLFVCLGVSAQVTVAVQGVTATQALLYYVAPDSNACSLQVSESPIFSPVVADVDPALFPNSDSDTARNVLPAGVARLVRVGLRSSALASDGRWHSRALGAESVHYARVICGQVSGQATFTTAVPSSLAPEPLPTDPNAWGNLAYPEFDFSDVSKPVIDPHTGLKIYTADPNGWSSDITIPASPGWYGRAIGWINPANIAAYSNAGASTVNTNPIALYLDASQLNDGAAPEQGGNWPYTNFIDLGLDIYGGGSDQSAGNRTIQAALSIDSGQTAYTPYITLALPANSQSAGTLPQSYPAAYFQGWGRALPRAAWPKRGYVTVAAGLVTLTKNFDGNPIGNQATDAGGYFEHDWPAGVKLFIANSAPACSNNLCTIASVQNATHLALVESFSLKENAYQSAQLAVVINKTNAIGSITLSARFRVARGYQHDIWTGGCAAKPVATTVDARGNPLGRTITGYPCIFPQTRQEPGGLYFVGSSEPTLRLVSLFRHPQNCCNPLPGHTYNDTPIYTSFLFGPTFPTFDPNDPTVIYNSILTNGHLTALFKMQYTGDWRALAVGYHQSLNLAPPLSTELTWANMTKSVEGRDIRTQVLANTNYDESKWGTLNSIQPVGLTGKYFTLVRPIAGAESVAWIFTFDSTTGNFYRAWRTDNGTSLQALKYAGSHSVSMLDNGVLMLTSNGLRWRNPAMTYGGPFTSPVISVKKPDSTFTSNTSLPWPPDSSYYSTCPTDLPAAYQSNGAVADQCVTVRAQEPCSSYATDNEITWTPCPWDAHQSILAPLAEGDYLKDATEILDNESFMVVRKTGLGSGVFEFILQRNAGYSYCALGKDGYQIPSQLMHPNGWVFQAIPPQACYAVNLLIDVAGNAAYPSNQNIGSGHQDISAGSPGSYIWIGAGSQDGYLVAYNRALAASLLKADYAVPQWPSFAGYDGGGLGSHGGTVQSYINARQMSASPEMRRYAFDFRHYNGSTGADLESPNQTLGAPTNLTLQSGTAAVYKLSYTGVADAKRGVLNVWAGEKVLAEKSSPALGNTLTDSDAWRYCYAYRAGECRTGANAGDMFAVMPRMDAHASCWASQLNLRVPCAFAGPVPGAQAIQVRIDGPDPTLRGQRLLGSLLMGPNQQYVYSALRPNPDASYLLFSGFLVSGYHTGLMMAKIPSFPTDSAPRASYIPVAVSGTGNSVYVEFGYEEFGSRTNFYCTARQETCRVSASSINPANPFFFASESLTPASGSYNIAIPVVPGRLVYYRVVTNGVPGPIQAAINSAIDLPSLKPPDLTVSLTHLGVFQVNQNGAFTITVTNIGVSATNGTVTVTDLLPSSTSAFSMSGSGWSCSVGTLTCTRSDSLSPNASYAPITVGVILGRNATTSVTSSVTVSGGGETNTSNNAATDTVITGASVTSDSVTPSAGNGIAQTFSFAYTDAIGANKLTWLYGLITPVAANPANACYVSYNQPTNSLYLANDAGTGLLSPALIPGSRGSVSNTQCTLDASGSSIGTAANTLTLNAAVTFKPLSGTLLVFMNAVDSDGTTSGFVQRGTWNVATTVPPGVPTLTPTAATGSSVQFVLTFTDANGYKDLTWADFQVSTGTAVNACYVLYNRPSNILYMSNTSATGMVGSTTVGPAGTTLTNGQCSVDGSAVNVAGTGNTLTIGLPVVFQNLSGSYSTYLRADTVSGASTGFVRTGSYVNGPAGTPSAVTVTPAVSDVQVGSSQTFTVVTGSTTGGSRIPDVPPQVTWSSTNTQAATVSNGTATCLTAGASTIIATLDLGAGPVSGSAVLNCSARASR